MEKIHTRIEIELDDVDSKIIDIMAKKMLSTLDEKELKLITKFNVMRMMISMEAVNDG